jgi:hypothetical protein
MRVILCDHFDGDYSMMMSHHESCSHFACDDVMMSALCCNSHAHFECDHVMACVVQEPGVERPRVEGSWSALMDVERHPY